MFIGIPSLKAWHTNFQGTHEFFIKIFKIYLAKHSQGIHEYTHVSGINNSWKQVK